MYTISTPLDTARRHAKVIETSQRVRWQIDRDVIRGPRADGGVTSNSDSSLQGQLMYTTLTRATLAQAAFASPTGPLQRVWQGLARWAQSLRARRQRRRELAELAQLDPHILRDLGIGFEELDSFVAEAQGKAERTRLRLALWNRGASR